MWMIWMAMAYAKCVAGSVSVVPAAISPHGPVVTEAYGTERVKAEQWKDGDLALMQGDVRVSLVRKPTLVSSFRDDQVLWYPETPLGDGTWTLQTGSTGLSSIALTVASPTGVWQAAPEVVKTERVEYGCGPAVSVEVTAPTDAALVQVQVGEVVAWLVPEDGRVRIGHGMCSGSFELLEGKEYIAYLAPLGSNGQPGEVRGVSFVAP